MAAREQEIKPIKVKDLVLWSENPRDPITADADNQAIVDRALQDHAEKWKILKLAEGMGKRYDLSELPTVVMHGKKPVVYDGNRRVIIGKIKLGDAKATRDLRDRFPEFPEEIPCNVCNEQVALENVYRKHADTGSWLPLERDIFLHKFMKKPKSVFLILEEATGILTENPYLNQGFVKKEIFNEEGLGKLGFSIKNEKLFSVHNKEEAKAVLSDISAKVYDKVITTRKARGNVLGVIGRAAKTLILSNKNKVQKALTASVTKDDVKKLTQRTRKKEPEIFGEKRYLASGAAANLYRDIKDLYAFYLKHKEELSASFPSLIRMALRLLCEEAAAVEFSGDIAKYIQKYFPLAKSGMSSDVKTQLHGQNVKAGSLVGLLHIGAHNYSSSRNLAQTIAISIALGEMLAVSHARE